MHSTISLFDYEPLESATLMSLDELVAEFEAPYAGGSNRRHGFAARHLLFWLKLRKIALADVDNAVIERFGKHRCHCRRYRTQPNRDPYYMTMIRMFVHLLEQRGVISARFPRDVASHFAPYATRLKAQGYVAKVVRGIMFDARHFAFWVSRNAIFRIDYQHAGPSQITLRVFNVPPFVPRPSRDLVNLRIGVGGGPVEVALFANNLFDENAPNLVGPLGVIGENIEQRPRVIGISANARF